jgi:dimethylargininase
LSRHFEAAVVRPPGDSFRLAISLHPERELIDPVRAKHQHEAYCAALAGMGVELIELAADERHPDSCFTQDPAVVLEGRALIGRLGVPSRAAEAESLDHVLSRLVESVDRLEEPATLEGGDVLRIANRLLVGRSTRTNDAGVESLRSFAEPMGYTVHPVVVPRGVLHLSTAVTALSDELVIGLDEVLENEAFRGMDKIPVGDAPLAGCNVLAVGEQVIASGDYAVHDLLEQRGFKIHRLNLSEFERADAGPTCLSLLIDRIPK